MQPLLGVAHGVVQQGSLGVRKLQELLDRGSVHGHAGPGHKPHGGAEQVHVLADDSRVGSHGHLGMLVATSELLFVGDDEQAYRGGLRPVLTACDKAAVVSLCHLLQGVFLVQVFRDALGRKDEHPDFLEVPGGGRGDFPFGGAVYADGREEQVRKVLVAQHLVAELRAGTAAPEGFHNILAAGLCRGRELLHLGHGKAAAE